MEIYNQADVQSTIQRRNSESYSAHEATTGDVQPLLALSERLLKVGHEGRVCTSEIYRDRFAKRGIDFYPVSVSFSADRLNQAMDAIVPIKVH